MFFFFLNSFDIKANKKYVYHTHIKHQTWTTPEAYENWVCHRIWWENISNFYKFGDNTQFVHIFYWWRPMFNVLWVCNDFNYETHKQISDYGNLWFLLDFNGVLKCVSWKKLIFLIGNFQKKESKNQLKMYQKQKLLFVIRFSSIPIHP